MHKTKDCISREIKKAITNLPSSFPPSIAMASSTRVLFPSFACSNCSDICGNDDPSCFFSSRPPPPPPPSDPDSTKVKINHKNTLLPGFLIAAGSLIALSFLLFLVSYVILRRRRRRRRTATAPSVTAPEPDAEDGTVTHHVWLIRTVGLDEATIGSISSFPYKSRSVGSDCTVCLAEFKDGETVKLLPTCGHPFHVSCVDTWLRSHITCPLCRAPVLKELDDDVISSSPGLEESGEASSSAGAEAAFQPVRRSVSMDAASLADLLESSEKKKVAIELEAATTKERVAAGMKRSHSTRSGRFFFPRYGRGRSASMLLPL